MRFCLCISSFSVPVGRSELNLTPLLYHAVKLGRTAIVQYLLNSELHQYTSYESEINDLALEEDDDVLTLVPGAARGVPVCWTALHYAMATARIPLVTLLLNHGADLTVQDTLQRTPYQVIPAKQNDLKNEVKLFVREHLDE